MIMKLFIQTGQRLYPAVRGCNGRYPKYTRRDRLALFFHRLPYRWQNRKARPDGKVVSRGRFHVPCILFGHLYETTEAQRFYPDFYLHSSVQAHECQCCGFKIKDVTGR